MSVARSVLSLSVSKIFILYTITSIAKAQNEEGSSPDTEGGVTSISQIQWSTYNIIALGTAIFVVGTGLVGLLAFFFPFLTYKICYFLGGCQNTLDFYVDKFIGNELATRKINGYRNQRSLQMHLDPIMMNLLTAQQKYESKAKSEESKS